MASKKSVMGESGKRVPSARSWQCWILTKAYCMTHEEAGAALGVQPETVNYHVQQVNKYADNEVIVQNSKRALLSLVDKAIGVVDHHLDEMNLEAAQALLKGVKVYVPGPSVSIEAEQLTVHDTVDPVKRFEDIKNDFLARQSALSDGADSSNV